MCVGRKISVDERTECQQAAILIIGKFICEGGKDGAFRGCKIPSLVITTARVGEDVACIVILTIMSIDRQSEIKCNPNEEADGKGQHDNEAECSGPIRPSIYND